MSSTPLRPTPSPTAAHIRSPLARVRGLGSAKEGASHFWKQRITGVANLLLVCAALLLMLSLIGADHATVKRTLQKPWAAIPLLLLIVSGAAHMRLGMQTIIEDYVHSEGRKLLCLMLNTFFAISVGLTCVYAVLKLTFASGV
jgi:succinate dehydrogenase / fumarate reductase membrane anchor subunit